MVATAKIASRISRYLQAILANVEDLPVLAKEWEMLPDGERASDALQWDHLMADYLTELDEHYRAGRMTSPQQACYQDLLSKLKEAIPIIQKLNLYRPPVPLEI